MEPLSSTRQNAGIPTFHQHNHKPLPNINNSRPGGQGQNSQIPGSRSGNDTSRPNGHLTPVISSQLAPTPPTQKQSLKKNESLFSRLVSTWITDWWGMELISWVVAALSITAIFVSLETTKNKPLPKWPFNITLNALISIFATVGQMAMMKPVVECISQLKWLWFFRSKRLALLQDFDEASRGPTGSLILLGKLRCMHLVSLGAIITVVSIAFGPVAQQVVTYPLRPHGIENATTPQAIFYTGASDFDITSSPELLAAVFNGLGANNQTFSNVNPSCSSGNCTWENYSSLGICANALDLSPAVISNPCNPAAEAVVEAFDGDKYPCFNYSLKNQGAGPDPLISNKPFFSNVSLTNGDSILPNRLLFVTFGFPSTSLASMYWIYQPDFQPGNLSLTSPVAFVSTLDFCLHTYSTTVLGGVTNTTLISSQLINTTNLANRKNKSFENATILAGSESFGITQLGFMILQAQIETAFQSSCEYLTKNGLTITVCSGESGSAFLRKFPNSNNSVSIVKGIMDNVAISLSNTLVDVAPALTPVLTIYRFRTGAGGDTQVSNFTGTTFSPEVFVESQYVWLTLPLSLVLLTLVFLIATISKSDRLGSKVWKSSNLPTLQALDYETQSRLGGLASLSEMKEKADSIRVKLRLDVGKGKEGSEWRLVGSK